MEIVKELLVHPKVNIDDATLYGYDLKVLRKQEIEKRAQQAIILKKRHDDRLFDSDLIVFMPLLKIIARNLSNFLNCKATIQSFTKEELQCLQQCVDIILYGANMNQFMTQLTNNTQNSMQVLFVLHESNGDLVSLKSSCVEIIKKTIDSCSQEECAEWFEKLHEYKQRCCSNLDHNQNLIELVMDYCLNVMAQKGLDTSTSLKWMTNDSMRDCVIDLLSGSRKSSELILSVHEKPNQVPQNPLKVLINEILKEDSSCNLELNIGNKKQKVHKTILASKSVYFESLLQSGHFNPENDVYGQEMNI